MALNKAQLMHMMDDSIDTTVTVTDIRNDLVWAVDLVDRAVALLAAVQDTLVKVDDYRIGDIRIGAEVALLRLDQAGDALRESVSMLPAREPRTD